MASPSIPHPQATHVDEQLARLRFSKEASTSPSYSICQRLGNLQELHESLDKLIRLAVAQHALAQEQNKKSVEQLLDGSFRILMDPLGSWNYATHLRMLYLRIQMKEGLKEIQSIPRRKHGHMRGEEILSAMKSFKKTFQKVKKSLKITQAEDNNDESLAFF
ncbi:unnamed protein product [Arabis nemorensis]|uniref:Uncharacterized protein n=1 Tax=Arabis nemorensis TaxID=586526 RepID=A0A565BCN2_9BRAS|nr:unnamed protein product [Arabis nemorensis]